MSDKPYDVFISYSSQDREAAAGIALECKNRGLRTWLADWKLGEQQDWRSEISRAISDATLCVVLVSGSTDPHGPWVSHEWSEIQQNVWRRPDFKVLPVVLGGARELPAFLREWQALHIATPDDDPSVSGAEVAHRIVEGSTGPSGVSQDVSTTARFRHLSYWIQKAAGQVGEDE